MVCLEDKESPASSTHANEMTLTSDSSSAMANTLQESESAEKLSQRAHEVLAEGKKQLLCRNYQEAATSLDQACDFFSKQFGEMAYECAEPYFYYGKSLVELVRANQSIINVKGKDEDRAEEEDESVSDESEPDETEDQAEQEKQDDDPSEDNAQDELNCEAESAARALESDADAETPVVTVEQIEEVANVSAEQSDQPSSSKHNGQAIVQEDGDDKSDSVASAWEMLDLARIIYEKHLNAINSNQDDYDELRKADSFRLAEVRMTLGELCALDEKFDEALSEFKEALSYMGSFCAPDDRRLAEIYFQMGSVSELDYKFDDAAKNINGAAEILKLRKANLEASLNLADAENAESIRIEIKELADLLIDISQRLADISESEKSFKAARNGLKEFTTQKDQSPSKDAASENSSNVQATDITHLVRKPLKHASDTPQDSQPKRIKVDGINEGKTENGHSAGDTNQSRDAPMI